MVQDKNKISFFFFTISSSSQHYLWKRPSFPILYSWQPCQRSVEYMCMNVCFLGSLFCSIGLYDCMSLSYYFNDCSFVICFEMKRCGTSSFVFLSQDCFSYSESFVVAYDFYDHFSSSLKICLGIWEFIDCLYHFLWYGYGNNISLSIHEYGLLFYFFVFSLMFFISILQFSM